MLNSKTDDEFKKGLLSTLKYLIEHLWFGPLPMTIVYDTKAMEILQERVLKIFAAAEKLQKEDKFKQHAQLLMA